MDEELELPSIAIAPLQLNMVVDDTPLVFDKDDGTANDEDGQLHKPTSEYTEEILQEGLVDSDVEYLTRAYKTLEEVKYIKIHCTGCDKHMGSAPNDLENRFQHPLLKVLLCAKCFQFYCSGEFEKGEDGSELYCRWCGEGGLVYCCTKCPFVFCKNCITRNLGRGTARIIENTEFWICFSCNPLQINRHRANYWAVQKWSQEMIELSKQTGDVTNLDVDSNICCQGKKRVEPAEKSRKPTTKKTQKQPFKMTFDTTLLESALQLQKNTPSTSTSKVKKYSSQNIWNTVIPLEHTEPEDQVICTPDIIPIDESPPHSPQLLTTPPPLIPYVMQQQSVSKIQPLQPPYLGKGKLIPINIKNLQKSVQSNFKKFTPITTSNVNMSLLSQHEGLRIVHHPAPSQTQSKEVNEENGEGDWFDKAIVECAEVTEYISTKISGLAGVHSRAHKSERLMLELHNTLQTYIHVAIDKMRRIKRNMQDNYDKEFGNNSKSGKALNPFAKTKILEDSSSQSTQSASEDDQLAQGGDDTNDTDSSLPTVNNAKKRKRSSKPNLIKTKIQRLTASTTVDDDVIFDMDVTNASDEEMESRTTSSVGSVGHFQTEEVINIISSDEDSDVEEVTITENTEKEQTEDTSDSKTEKEDTLPELLSQVSTKFNIKNMTTEDLLNYLSPKVVLYNNRRAKKQFSKTATTPTKLKEFNIVETIQNILNPSTVVAVEPPQPQPEDQPEEACDVEEMLGSAVVLRAKKNFSDEFSRFIGKSSQPVDEDELITENNDEITENNDEISAESNDEITENNDEISAESNDEITENNDEISAESNDEITKNNDEITENNDEITENNDEISAESNDEITENNDAITENNDKITENNDAITENNDEITENNDEIKENNDEITDKNDELTDKNDELTDKNDELTDKNDKIAENNDEQSTNNTEEINKSEENNTSVNKSSDDSELDDEADLFFNKDNESLSLPPDGIGDSLTTNNIFATKERETPAAVVATPETNSTSSSNSNSDLVLDSGILALKQMAENCVNPTVELRQAASTECSG